MFKRWSSQTHSKNPAERALRRREIGTEDPHFIFKGRPLWPDWQPYEANPHAVIYDLFVVG